MELIHSVTYFDPRCASAMSSLGLKGFWMGYFAGRSAPLGTASPAVVTATFSVFAPRRVERALTRCVGSDQPQAMSWRPGAGPPLMSSATPCPRSSEPLNQLVPLLTSVVRAGSPTGRPVFAANQSLELPTRPGRRPVAVRHIVAGTPRRRTRRHPDVAGNHRHRGQSPHDRGGPIRRRRTPPFSEMDRPKSGTAPPTGSASANSSTTTVPSLAPAASCRQRSSRPTDDLAHQPMVDGLTPAGLDLLPRLLRPVTTALVAAAVTPFPNPIGLDAPES